MRPTPLIGLLAVAALGGAVAPAQASDRPPLSAKLATCTTGADELSRAAAFSGAMPAAATTKRMQMRFVLLQRVGAGPKGAFKKLAVPGWGVWEKSDPGRNGFVFTKRVEALAAPAGYRAAVSFRWYDAKGHVTRATTRTTPVCEQPDPRADLVLGGLGGASTGRATAAYTVSVENDGHAEAEPFAVTVTVDGVVSEPVVLGPLAAGDRVQGALAAPKCTPGSTITITGDAADVVDESVEDDDVVQRPCPLA
jgi:CARDB